ncbi:MAG: peptidylprolyl isomerase [Egibacteraceae bacterium]
MSGKQHKRELKRQKAAAREAARRADRRRTAITAVVIAAIVLIGSVAGFATVNAERGAVAEQAEAAQGQASEQRVRASEATAAVADREVACGGQPPATESEPKPTFSEAPTPENVLQDGVDYRAVIETSCGTLRLDLAEEQAPQAVSSFVFLARQGFFDGLEIFRNATTIGALQTGSGTNAADFQIGYTLEDELEFAQEEGYPPGAVAMANSGPDTAGSQFFFVYNDSFDEAFAENRVYTRFATVSQGLGVLRRIGAISVVDKQVAPETPSELVVMERVRILPAGQAGSGDAGAELPGTERTEQPTPQSDG